MTIDPSQSARTWAQQLPREFARQLAEALREGRDALQALRADTVLPASTAAVRKALDLTRQGDGPYAAGLLTGRLDASAAQPQITPVWTGPESATGGGRLTLAVIADLIDEAQREIILVSYATIPGENIRGALEDAARRGAQITLLLERNTDNPNFNASHDPFPDLTARRLAWPAVARPAGASLHAKVLVVDRETALVGSANLTGYALERNLECGLLLRGGQGPQLLAQHLLTAAGIQQV